jgi:hypothetical protein
MSASREKDQKDFDLEQIVRVIDSALESDDQRIKDALRALMTITVLCTAEHPDQMLKNGPLARVFEDMRNLNQRLGRLEDDLNKIKWNHEQKRQIEPFIPPYQPPTSPYDPRVYPNDPTKVKPMWDSTWSAGDDPNYKGASSGMLAEDFIKELEKR